MDRKTPIEAWVQLVRSYSHGGSRKGVRDLVELSGAAPEKTIIEVLPHYANPEQQGDDLEQADEDRPREYRYVRHPDSGRYGWVRCCAEYEYRLEAVYWMVGPQWLADRCRYWRPKRCWAWYTFATD